MRAGAIFFSFIGPGLLVRSGPSFFRIGWCIDPRCQPCRMVYDYIMDIDTAQEDSEYVFKELEFDARLPAEPNHANGTVNKTLEDYYKDIPKSLIKKIYAKYYLDFVLYGFSTESVEAIVNVGTEKPSNYHYTRIQFVEFNQFRIVIYRGDPLDVSIWQKKPLHVIVNCILNISINDG